jgi:hypothetical protein
MDHLRTQLITAAALIALSLATAKPVAAQEWPVVWGDYWEVAGIRLKDGGTLAYARFLADEWRKDQEFAKSKGWIKSYKLLWNAHPRHDEPHLYLVTISEKLPSGPEFESRDVEYMAWKKKSATQMEKETGDRAEYREVLAGALLQELTFR